MNAEEVESLIATISWGNKFIQVTDQHGRERRLVIKPLSLFFRNFVDFIYRNAYETAVSNGIMTEKEMRRQLAEVGSWTPEDDKNLENLHSSLIEAAAKMESGELNKRDMQIFRKLIKSTEDKIAEMEGRRDSCLDLTCERYATDMKSRAVFYGTVHNEMGERMWPDWETFQDSVDVKFLSNISRQLLKRKSNTIAQIRELARSPLWRNKWMAAKNTGDLFGKPIVELTDEQNLLIYWSQAYDSVYESMDRPSDDVINNDEKLDKWFEAQSKKIKSGSSKTSNESGNSKISSATGKHGEIFVVVESEEELNDVYNLNDPLSRKFINHQQNKLEKFHELTEQELRNDSDSRKVIGSKDAVFNVKRDRSGLPKRNVTQILPGGTLKGK